MAAERPLSAFASPGCAAGVSTKRPETSQLRGIIHRGVWGRGGGFSPLQYDVCCKFLNWYFYYKIIISIHTKEERKNNRRVQNQIEVIIISTGRQGIFLKRHFCTVAWGKCAFFFLPSVQAVGAAAGRGPGSTVFVWHKHQGEAAERCQPRVSGKLHLFDCIFTQEHNYQYREPLVKASKPVVLTRD